MVCRRYRVAVVVLATMGVASVMGCGGDDPGSGSQAAEVSAAQGESPAAVTEDESWMRSVAFVDAVATNRFSAARRLAAPDSAANRYARHQQAMYEGQVALGYEPSVYSIRAVERTESIKLLYSSDDVPPLTFTDFDYDSAGLLVDFQTGGSLVSDRLWALEDSASVQGVDFGVVSAYQSTQGGLFVVIEAASSSRPVTLSFSPTYRDPQGRQTTASDAYVPDELQPNAKSLVMYRFPIGRLGGTFQMEFWPGDSWGQVQLDVQ